MTVKPYRVHTRVVFDMATGAVLEDEWHLSTVQPALCGAAAVAAIAAAVIAAGSAIYAADRQRYSSNMQQDALLRTAAYNREIAGYQEQERQLAVQAAYERNSYEQQMVSLQAMRQGMLLELYGIQMDVAQQRLGLQAQSYLLQKEVYDWKLATLDWEADFRMKQAEFIAQQGEYDRSLYGKETAGLLARHRARMAAAGWDIGTGSPVAVLGAVGSDRDYVQDIMKFGTDVQVWEKEYESKQLLNEKSNVRFGSAGADLNMMGNLLDNRETMAGYRMKAAEAGLSLAQGSLQQGLLSSERLRIGMGSAIDLGKYQTNMRYADVMTHMQSSVYSTAAGAAGVGGWMNAGAALFNGANNYYTTTPKTPNTGAIQYGYTAQY